MATKKQWEKWNSMRDESWRRWKGGTKLADELRVFYTSKGAMDRIARNNAVGGLAAGTPAPNGEMVRKGAGWNARRRMDFREIGKQKQVLQAVYGQREAAAPSAPLPGKDSPTR